MFKADFDIVQEGHYRHSQHDTSFDNEDLSKKMQKLYANLFYLKHELNHLTKSECLSKLVKTYNILSELYDIIDYDYTEDPQKTSRLGFAKLPQKTKHRDEIDDLMIEIRMNIQELNHQSWSRDGVKKVIRKMLEVYEYEQRELDSLKPFVERIRSTGVDKVSHKLAKLLMDSSVETIYDEIIQEEKLSTDDRKELKDQQFGIPSLRKYPLTDEKHVLQAVRFFSKAPEEYKEELARNIVKRAKQLGMDWTKWDVLKPYLDESVQEATMIQCSDNREIDIPAGPDKTLTVDSKDWDMIIKEYPEVKDKTVKAGSLLYRITNRKESIGTKRKYVTLTRADALKYTDPKHGIVDNKSSAKIAVYKLKKELKIAGADAVLDILEKVYHKSEFGFDDIKYFSFLKPDSRIVSELNKQGYGGLFDPMDIVFAKTATVIFNPKDIIELDHYESLDDDDDITQESAKVKYVSNFKYDKVYFGTPNPYPDGIDCDRPLFVTPFKSLACIFAASQNLKELGVPRGRYNRHFDEWKHPKDEYIDEIHMQVEGCDDETEHVVKMHGYVYEVDVSDLKDHIGKYDWMAPQLEYLVCDQDHIDWSNQKKVNVTVHWTGQKSNNPKYHQEAFTDIKFKEDIPHDKHDELFDHPTWKQLQTLYDKIHNYKVGIPNSHGKVKEQSEKKIEKNYHFLSPQEFEKYKGGLSLDYNEYVRDYCEQHNIDFKQFYIITETKPTITHTLTIVPLPDLDQYALIHFGFDAFGDNTSELLATELTVIKKDLDGSETESKLTLKHALEMEFDRLTRTMFRLKTVKKHYHQFKYSVFQYKGHPKYGSTKEECMDWMSQHGQYFCDGMARDQKYQDQSYQEAAVPVDQLKQMVGEIYQQALQVKYGCLDEDGERITASPFQDSWKMIVDYHSQSIESIEESKLGVCFEHSFYVADLLKKKNLPYQTFFLNVNILNEDDPSSQMTFWHQFTIVPNDTDSVVLIETSLTPEKNGVFLVKDMEDAVQHLINSFNINIPQESIEFMKQDLLDVSEMEPRDGDTYLGYIDLVYQNGKLIKDEIRIKHRNEMIKIYWDYMKEHNYLSYDGDKVYEQIKDFNPDTPFELYSISRVNELFTDEGNKFNQDIGVLEPQTFFSLTPKEMESKLKGFVQESYMEDHHDNKLKSEFRYVPLTPKSAKKYASQGSFKYGLARTRVNKDTHGAIYITDSDIVVGYVAIEKKANGERWITALEVSTEYQGHGYGVDLLQIAVDEFKADHLSVNKKNEHALQIYLKYGWAVYDASDHMYFMKLKDGDDNDE